MCLHSHCFGELAWSGAIMGEREISTFLKDERNNGRLLGLCCIFQLFGRKETQKWVQIAEWI